MSVVFPVAEGGGDIDNNIINTYIWSIKISAAQGRSLVILIDGEVKNVPAKELLAQLSENG